MISIPTKGQHSHFRLQLDCGWFGFVLVNGRDCPLLLCIRNSCFLGQRFLLLSFVGRRWRVCCERCILKASWPQRKCFVRDEMKTRAYNRNSFTVRFTTRRARGLGASERLWFCSSSRCFHNLLLLNNKRSAADWRLKTEEDWDREPNTEAAYNHLLISFSIDHKLGRPLNLTDGLRHVLGRSRKIIIIHWGKWTGRTASV